MSDASASRGARVGDVPTPFHDLLTAMIQAQALENELIRQRGDASGHDDPLRARNAYGGFGRSHGSNARDAMQNLRRIEVATLPRVADRTWRALTQRFNASIAGLIVAAAIGGVILFLQASMRQPLVVAAVNDRSDAKSPAVAAVGAAKEPALRVERPSGPGKPGVEEEPAIARGTRADKTVAAHSDDPRVAPPVAAQAIQSLAADAEKLHHVEDAPAVQSSSESPQAAPAQPLSGKTGSAIDPANDTVAVRIARAIDHVNMRAGPGNDKAVVMRIPAGSPVQVVECRHWCEVIFAGQQGWVYKDFIGIPRTPRQP